MMDTISIKRLADGRLTVRSGNGEPTAVRACACFPWEHPGRYISLRDDEDKEVVLIADIAELDGDSRAALEAGLAEAAFVPEITQIHSIETELEIRNWTVHTLQGPCIFQTKLDEWPLETVRGGLIIRGITGNMFQIQDPSRLDAESRKCLAPFVG